MGMVVLALVIAIVGIIIWAVDTLRTNRSVPTDDNDASPDANIDETAL